MRYFILLSLSICCLTAQDPKPYTFSGGFKLGAPINNPSGQTFYSGSKTDGRWTGGATLEFHLPYRFSVEVDALYRNSQSNFSYPFQLSATSNAYTSSSNTNKRAWDVPVLLKYRFNVGPAHPFVSAGYSTSFESGKTNSFYQCSGPQGSCLPAEYPSTFLRNGQYHFSNVLHGPVAGVGMEFKTRHVTISPEMRFSRPTYGYPRENRFTGLVGFTFGRK